MKHSTCPICNEPLVEGDKLLSYFYEPKDWWVVMHLKPDESKSFEVHHLNVIFDKTEVYCHEAGFIRPVRLASHSLGEVIGLL